ncbi:MAG: hypothetical protein KBC42_00420 [Candidatus Pacebacteria bacterium]|jgi:hypothetical protein|nr:hypothetical protein [Candidatus Paceibacterota bacterium]MBP9780371.1 hypothetical protein [Candidatus Paceibacterota bacterium]MDQ5950050.1 hypothetical protein [Patescibacteria group bacterium]MDQ5961753.1 hypothetical protein [Patescibacteria group bacterium]
MENKISQTTPSEQTSFRKSGLVKTLAIIQLIAFVGQVVFFLTAIYLPNLTIPEISIVVVGWMALVGGAVYGVGPIMTISSIVLLFTKNKKIYRTTTFILLICLAWGITLFTIGFFALRNWQ